MTRSWSHTQEGMQNVDNAIRELDDETLATVYAEWTCATLIQGRYVHSETKWTTAFPLAKVMVEGMRPEVIDFIIDKTNALAECDNGGFEAHICPHGCHRVSFDSNEPTDEQDDPDHNFR